MIRIAAALCLLVLASEPALAQLQPPKEVALPAQLIEQIYTYLQTKPYADVAPLIDGMRQAVAKATKQPEPPPAPAH